MIETARAEGDKSSLGVLTDHLRQSAAAGLAVCMVTLTELGEKEFVDRNLFLGNANRILAYLDDEAKLKASEDKRDRKPFEPEARQD